MVYLPERSRLPWWLKILLWLGDRAVGRRLSLTRVLAHYPRALISSGLLEALVTHLDRRPNRRLLQLVRLQVSLTVSCPFCIDMNAKEYRRQGITRAELEALQGKVTLEAIESFTEAELAALRYTRVLSSTPLRVGSELVDDLLRYFRPREVVILASTAAQVNYWTRLIQGLGLSPAGFIPECRLHSDTSGSRRFTVEWSD